MHNINLFILTGDIETNPGPMFIAEGEMMTDIHEVVKRVEVSQTTPVA